MTQREGNKEYEKKLKWMTVRIYLVFKELIGSWLSTKKSEGVLLGEAEYTKGQRH